mgnify:CR=1 FL=1
MALNINGTTGISGVDGSVSAPALRGTDNNTGITFPAADTIKFSTGGVERMQITNSGVTGTGIGAGKILQVKQAFKTDGYSQSSTSFADITGLSVSITPASSSNKILVMVNIFVSVADAALLRLLRDSTVIGAGTGNSGGSDNTGFAMARMSASNLSDTHNVTILDTPSTTSATTYKVQGRPTESSANLFVNRRGSDTSYGAASSITVMEVGA